MITTATRAAIAKARTPTLVSIFERLVNRGASVIVGFAVLLVSSPTEMGVYATIMLGYAFVTALGEISVRQVAAALWRRPGADDLIRAACRRSMVMAFLVSTAVAAGVVTTHDLDHVTTLGVFAFALAPVAGAAAQRKLSLLQFHGDWSSISRAQMIASAASLVVGLALVRDLGIGAGLLQTIICEVSFLAAVSCVRAQIPEPRLEAEPAKIRGWIEFRDISAGNFLAWLQNQSERLSILTFAGGALLGVYSTAAQLSRTVSDAAATGFVNVLRVDLATSSDQGESFRRGLRRAGGAGLALQLVALGFSLVLLLVLPPIWDEALLAGTLLTATIPLMLMVWAASTLVVVRGQTKHLYPWQIWGILCCAAAGPGMASSLFLGISILAIRDAVGCAGRLWVVRAKLGFVVPLIMPLATAATAVVLSAAGFATVKLLAA